MKYFCIYICIYYLRVLYGPVQDCLVHNSQHKQLNTTGGMGLHLVSSWDHFKHTQLAPGLPHVPLLLGTHVRARPNKSPCFVQVGSFHPS